jgi:hypothetical protein
MSSPISPAAQAIKDAVFLVYKTKPEPSLGWADDLPTIAAALRAAAEQLRDAYANEEYVDSADDWLDGIAAELETQ